MQEIKTYPRTEKPKTLFGCNYSVDVITIDASGNNRIAYYSLKEKQWVFHSFSPPCGIEWVWYYPPV